jgi:phosphohistidine phosphatase
MKDKTLLVLRHGKSDWSTGLEDFHRPLVSRGRVGSRKMGAWIRHLDLLPDTVLSSPAERARMTTVHACKAMGVSLDSVRWDERLYATSVAEHLAALADCPKTAGRVMLVGHNPGLEELVEYLAAGEVDVPADGKLLPTSTLAQLEMTGEWKGLKRGCARIVAVTRPAEVPEDIEAIDKAQDKAKEKARAKAGDEEKWGPVPDYFFTQSAVIPYRIADGKPEIMLITSRKGTRWVLPKGVKEPELSLRDSASKEAFEEAGVRGELDAEPIGHYEYAKWGGTCKVAVFPMAVSECLPDGEWEESHRERQWVGAKEAKGLLDEPELGKLVGNLAKRLTDR